MNTRWLSASYIRWCVRGDQQVYQVIYRDAPVLKATEARLLVAIADQRGAELYGTDTEQEFLCSDVCLCSRRIGGSTQFQRA